MGGALGSLPPGVRLPVKGPKVGGKLKKKPSKLKITKAPPRKDPREDGAATKIQAQFRGRRDRKRVASMPRPAKGPTQEEMDEAATRIQAVYRGRRDRKRVASMPRKPPPPPPPTKEEQDRAATDIQAVYRGRRDRRRVAEMPRVPPPQIPSQEEQDLATSKIQAVYRGRRDRKRVAAMPRKPPPPTQEEMDAAAAKIQAQYRGRRDRQRVAEMKAARPTVEIPSSPIRAPPPMIAKSAAQNMQEIERLKTELSEARRQLSLKSQAVIELNETIDDQKDEIKELEAEVKASDEQAKEQQKEIKTLEEALEKELDDFDKLRLAFDEKDRELNAQTMEMMKLKEDLSVAGHVNDKLMGENRKLAKRIESMQPKMVDAALSARSIDETPQLRARDELLVAKDRQIGILNRKIEELTGQLDVVEDELNHLQEDLVARDIAYNKKKTEAAEYLAEVKALTRSLQEQRGRDIAVDTAARQNQQLLQLLEAAEKATNDAGAAKEEAMQRMKDLQSKLLATVREAAGHEAEKEVKARDARVLGRKVATMETRYATREQRLVKELSETREAAQTQLESMQEELRVRREKQYSLLDKLSKTEEALHTEQHRADDAESKIRVLQQRNLELEASILQAKKWRADDAAAAKERQEKLQADVDRQETELRELLAERETLTRQVSELGSTLSELTDAREKEEFGRRNAEEKTRGREGEVLVLRERVAQLMDEGLRANKARVDAEAAKRSALERLRALRAEHLELLVKTKGLGDNAGKVRALEESLRARFGDTGTMGPVVGTPGAAGSRARTPEWLGNSRVIPDGRDPAAVSREAELRARLRSLQTRVEREVGSKRRAIERMVLMHAHVARRVADAGKGADLAFANAGAESQAAHDASALPDEGDGGVLSLAGLNLTDEDVAVLVETMSTTLPAPVVKGGPVGEVERHRAETSVRRFRSIDLRYNQISDAGAMLLAQLLSGASFAGATTNAAAGALNGTGDVGSTPGPGSLPLLPTGEGQPLGTRLANLDLRGNRISGAGVRALAEAVRANTRLGVRHVYVGRGGLIQALGVPPERKAAKTGPTTDADVAVVSVVDVSDNSSQPTGDAAVAAREARTAMRTHSAVAAATETGAGAGGLGGAGTAASAAPPPPPHMSASTVGGAVGAGPATSPSQQSVGDDPERFGTRTAAKLVPSSAQHGGGGDAVGRLLSQAAGDEAAIPDFARGGRSAGSMGGSTALWEDSGVGDARPLRYPGAPSPGPAAPKPAAGGGKKPKRKAKAKKGGAGSSAALKRSAKSTKQVGSAKSRRAKKNASAQSLPELSPGR